MTSLYNFSVKKSVYNDMFIISWQICPKAKNYVITKILKLNKQNLLKLLKHLKNSKKINFIKERLKTWLDYGSSLD